MAPEDAPRTRWAVARVLFGHRSTHVILVSLLPLVVVRAMAGPVGTADAWAMAIVAALWPALEWVMHVGMHVPPLSVGRWNIDPEICRSHRRHHEHPGIVDDLLLPPLVLAGLALVAWTALPWLAGRGPGWSAAIAFHVGGLLNGWVHLLTHSGVRPHTRYYAWVRKTHTLHHCKDHRRWFSFTGPWLDGWRG
ncbi:MAG: sterol desaturase family protein [Nannocystaceae bacterium]|nr:sterol desaturase family protein [Nannocystaceae bacterium]